MIYCSCLLPDKPTPSLVIFIADFERLFLYWFSNYASP